MPYFSVKCYESGIWDGEEHQTVEARDEKEAAEKACGGPLVEVAKPGLLRATVQPVSNPTSLRCFGRE